MNIKALVIERFAKFMFGGVPFESMKRIVADWHSSALSGPEKRQAVLEEFESLGYALAGCLVNLGLELAVAYLKSKTV